MVEAYLYLITFYCSPRRRHVMHKETSVVSRFPFYKLCSVSVEVSCIHVKFTTSAYNYCSVSQIVINGIFFLVRNVIKTFQIRKNKNGCILPLLYSHMRYHKRHRLTVLTGQIVGIRKVFAGHKNSKEVHILDRYLL